QQPELQEQVAGRLAARARLALRRHADLLAVDDAGRDLHLELLDARLELAVLPLDTLQRQRARGAVERLFERDVDLRVRVEPAPLESAATRAPGPAAQSAETAEQLVEEIAVLARAILALELEVPVRRRPELLAGRTAPELVVRRALLGIAEHFVGFADFFEPRLGVLFLADVGVELPREASIRALDLVGRRISRDTHDLVVVFKFHCGSAAARGASLPVTRVRVTRRGAAACSRGLRRALPRLRGSLRATAAWSGPRCRNRRPSRDSCRSRCARQRGLP